MVRNDSRHLREGKGSDPAEGDGNETTSQEKSEGFFRVLDLSEAQVAKMQTQIDGAKYGFRKYRLRRAPKVIGAEFTLKDKQSYNDLIRFLKVNKINKSSYGIWISLITNEDTGGIHVPEYVLKLYEKTGGNLDFTFTCG